MVPLHIHILVKGFWDPKLLANIHMYIDKHCPTVNTLEICIQMKHKQK
jgi:hypothetical protein